MIILNIENNKNGTDLPQLIIDNFVFRLIAACARENLCAIESTVAFKTTVGLPSSHA
jgi:hypothetical protein